MIDLFIDRLTGHHILDADLGALDVLFLIIIKTPTVPYRGRN